jgi:hypothetical protein
MKAIVSRPFLAINHSSLTLDNRNRGADSHTPRSHCMRSTVLSLLLSSVSFFCSNAAVAQQSNKPAAAVPQHPEDLSAVGQGSKGGTNQSSPEIQSLIKALAGKWSVNVKFEPSSAMPNGADGTGEEVWCAGPGGIHVCR